MSESEGQQLSWDMLAVLLRAQDSAAQLRVEYEDAKRESDAKSARITELEGSISFRLGFALVSALRSWRGLTALPRRLAQLARRRAPNLLCSAPEPSPAPQPALDDRSLTARAFQSFVPVANTLSELRIACVLDAFTRACFAPECELFELPSCGFEPLIDQAKPHLLLVESAWRGTDGSWRQRIRADSPQLHLLLDCCRRRGIPTVFWNKEDPSHFEHFLETARLFDHVFTTDADSIPRYRAAFGHDRVDLLQFGCQPRIHHPIEPAERKDGALFAGSWYRQYPQRSRAFSRLADVVAAIMPVTIYDRNHDRGDPAFAFPDKYAAMLRPGLPYEHMIDAYRQYRFGISVNTITESPTMFARRVYELMACNTIVVSNPSVGLASTFGDRVVICGDGSDCRPRLRDLHGSPTARHALRLRALREVLKAHTAAHRLAKLANTVLDTDRFAPPRAQVLVVAMAQSQAEAAALLAAYGRQQWPDRELMLVVADALESSVRSSEEFAAISQVCVVSASAADAIQITELAQGRRIACFDPRDRYESEYLTDLALAALYAPDAAVGKGAYFVCSGGKETLQDGPIYRSDAALCLRSALIPAETFEDRSLLAALMVASEAQMQIPGIAVDEFSYCREGNVRYEEATSVAPVPASRSEHGIAGLRREDFRIFYGGYAAQVAEGFRARRDTPALRLAPPLDWDMDPFGDRNWRFQLHAWRMLGPIWNEYYGKDWARLRAEALPWVRDWYRFHVVERRDSVFAWYDMSVGLRAQHLALLVSLHRHGVMPLSDADWEMVEDLGRLHVRKLREKHFIKRNNHGMFQLTGLRLLAVAMHGDPVCNGELEYSTRMMRVRLDSQFDPHGVHKENSPDYHGLIVKQVARIRPALFPEIANVLRRIAVNGRAILPWFTLPDGRVAPIGDSEGYGEGLGVGAYRDAVLRTSAGDEVWVRDLTQSGYAVARTSPQVPAERAAMLIVKGQAFSQTHAHADHLGFLLYAGGRPILVDSGKYGYARDDWREYFVSDRAHNVVGIQGRAFGPQHTTSTGAGLERLEVTSDYVRFEGEVRRGDSFGHRREVRWFPVNRVEVTDHLEAPPTDAPVAYWHLSPDLDAERFAGGVAVFDNGRRIARLSTDSPGIEVRLVHGQKAPHLQGWVSPSYGGKAAAMVIEFRAPRGATSIRTCIELLDEPRPAPKSLPRPLTHGIRFNFPHQFKRDKLHVLSDGRTQRRVIVTLSEEDVPLANKQVAAQLKQKGFSGSSPIKEETYRRVAYSHPDGTVVVTRSSVGRPAQDGKRAAPPTFYLAWSRLPSSERKKKRPVARSSPTGAEAADGPSPGRADDGETA